MSKLEDYNLSQRFRFKLNDGFQFKDGSLPEFEPSQNQIPEDYFKDFKEHNLIDVN